MTTSLSKTASALALAVAAAGAQAAEVMMDFETLGAQAIAANGGLGAPITVGSSIPNFLFNGAFAFEWDMLLTGTDTKPSATPLNDGGFIMNESRSSGPADIELTLTGSNASRYFAKVSFDMFVTAATPYLKAYSGSTSVWTSTFSPGGSSKTWGPTGDISWSAVDAVDRLVFGATGGGVIGIDNLHIDFIGSSTGNNVPEPASFGLVALALLGAGVAGRRRKPA